MQLQLVFQGWQNVWNLDLNKININNIPFLYEICFNVVIILSVDFCSINIIYDFRWTDSSDMDGLHSDHHYADWSFGVNGTE